MRIMGIDYGDSRIGIAVSDPFGWTAQGVETINSKGSEGKVLDRIIELIKQYNVEKIVVGYPRNMNGTIGPRAEKTDQFIKLLSARTDIDIIRWDERLSSVAANRTMHEIGTKTAKKKAIVDQIAACYILQGYLDSIKN
ncbi:MAG TPA: Holliday junction resolvase RuvX [Clostridiaceae bacterium]|nr:Holliday junction resolvase RuvX [Clostridiaceae bacterium]